MANSYIEYSTAGTGTNGMGQATFSFETLDVLNANDVNIFGRLANDTKVALTISSRDASAKTITLSASPTAAYCTKVRVYRQTTSNALVDFVDGARLTESDLDTAYKQGLFVAQEVSEDAAAIGTTSTNNLSLSGTTTVANLTATGTVVIPSGTAATHFYREGTWTPTVTGHTSISYANQLGSYTKIGNTVHIHLYLRWTGTASGNLVITGLPFTSRNNDANEGEAVNISLHDLEDAKVLAGYIGKNSTSISFKVVNNNGAAYSAPSVSGKWLIGSGTYTAA